MLKSRPLTIDDCPWGTVYLFEKAGDVLPAHTHTEESNHITALLYGSLRCMGHSRYEGAVIRAQPGGTIVNWKAGEPHGFVALEDGTTIMNLAKARL